MNPSDLRPQRDRLAAAVISAAVAHIETAGPLDDHAEGAQALRARTTRAEQIAERNWLLGERLGLPRELARWRRTARWTGLTIAAVLAFAGFAAARSVLAPDHSINAVAALVGLLGLNTLTLLAWLVSLAWMLRRGASAALPDWSLGRGVLALSTRLPGGHTPERLHLLHGLGDVLRRERLGFWLGSSASHAIWALALALTVATLLFGFAFQSYRLSWETTILTPGFFQWLVQATGTLPGALGFPVPDAAAVAQVGQAAAAAGQDASQRAWAWWLIGCVVVWGLLPRLLLAAWSVWRLRASTVRLSAVDMATPHAQALARRFETLEAAGAVVDAEQATRTAVAPRRIGPLSAQRVAIAFELPPEITWPPADWPPGVDTPHTSGSANERAELLERLRAAAPAKLLVAVHAAASPDRGTARFLRAASGLAGAAALLPIDPGEPASDGVSSRWSGWLQREELSAIRMLTSPADAARWLG